MKFRTTYRLFIAVCLLGAVIWLAEKPRRQREEAQELPPVKRDEIAQLIIEKDGLRVACTNQAGVWFLERPVRAQADSEILTRLLCAIEAVDIEDTITAEQRRERTLPLLSYGLNPPRARLLFRDSLGWKEWQIGTNVPLSKNLLYAKLASRSDVVVTSSELFDAIPDGVETLRDRTVLHGEASRTMRVEIKCAGAPFIQLTQSETGWLIKQPVEARADTGKVLEILDALYGLQAEAFVWDPGGTGSVVAKPDMGDEPAARVTVWMIGDRVGREIDLGGAVEGNAKQIYAKRRDFDSVTAVTKSVLDAVSVSVNEIRDLNLFAVRPELVKRLCLKEGDRKLVLKHGEDAGWEIAEPVQWKADEEVVQDALARILALRTTVFLDGSKADLDSLGLEPPTYSVEVGDPVQSLHFGYLPIGDNRTVFARFSESKTLLRINLSDIDWLVSRMAEPLVYRDRTVLAIPSEHITGISLKQNNLEQAVARDDNGGWVSSVPATNRVDAKAINEVLFLVSCLRATRIEVEAPKNLAEYGLAQPRASLTFGLSEKEGIQKTLLLGKLNETEGVYAMVQGMDVVFVLAKRVVGRLTRELCLPVNQEPGD